MKGMAAKGAMRPFSLALFSVVCLATVVLSKAGQRTIWNQPMASLASGVVDRSASSPVVPPPVLSPPVVSSPGVSTPVVSSPVVSPPGVSSPGVSIPVVSSPVVSPPGVSSPGVSPSVVSPPVVFPPVIASTVVSSPVVSPTVVSPPVVSSPVISSPVVSSPVVSPTVVSPPVVSSPVISSPVVSSPVVSPPVVFPPGVSSPVVFPPVVSSPVVSSPVVSPPVVFPPVVSSPVVSPPVVSSPGVSTPVVYSPVVYSPVVSPPVVFSPVIASTVVYPTVVSSPVVSPPVVSPPVVFPPVVSPTVVSSPVVSSTVIPSPVVSSLPPPSPCFRDESLPCTCRGSTANCSHTHGRLSYIPTFPGNITTLIFTYNNLTSISTGTFFNNVTGLVGLVMSHNGLGSIHPDAFKPMTKLRNLDLSSNSLNYSELSAIFAAGEVRNLHVGFMQLGPLPHGYFHRTPMVQLMYIRLSGNPIRHLNFSVLAPIRYLTKLKCVSCRLISITPGHLQFLKYLQLRDNYLPDFPDSCNGSSFYPYLKRLNLNGNSISGFCPNISLPRLKDLDLGGNRISTVKQGMFNGRRFPKLYYLNLASTQRSIRSLDKYAFQNPSLQRLSLMYCYIGFREDTIHPDCFAGMSKLKMLQLSNNQGSDIPAQKLNRLFASVTSLEQLFVGSFGLQSIHSNPFAKLTKLKVLNLYKNKFTEIPDGAFDQHPNLTELGFNDCMVRTVRSSTFNATTRKRLRRLDFSGNPLLCDCDLLWFKNWFVSSPKLFDGFYENYVCANLNNERLQSFSLNEQVCFFSRDTYTFLISSISLFVVVLSAACTCYPYRWHVRLVLYEAFRGREGEAQRRRRLEMGRFDYDVFVSYAHGDLAWVRDHLMPEMEGRLGLRLCVHDRDFIPGNNIVDNIVGCVGASKKVLVLFSRDFVASQWCQFELNLCLRHVMEHDDALLVTCLGDVTAFDVTKAMLAVLKVTTYIQWEDSAAARASFWGRLRLAVGDILPR